MQIIAQLKLVYLNEHCIMRQATSLNILQSSIFITSALMWLFICQVGALTLAYIGIVVGAALVGTTDLKNATNAIIEAVKVIVPVTTTLLGVVIGYYFRERIDAGAQGAYDEE
jgi:hypothetical protein